MKKKLAKLLFKYHITLHSSTGVAPAELLMGRCSRSRLDLLKSDLAAEPKLTDDGKQLLRVFSEDEPIYMQDFTASKQKWILGNIQIATGPVSYFVTLFDGSTVIRHFDNIKA